MERSGSSVSSVGGHERVEVVQSFGRAVLIVQQLHALEAQRDLLSTVARPLELTPEDRERVVHPSRAPQRAGLESGELEAAVVVDERGGVVEMAERVLERERVEIESAPRR